MELEEASAEVVALVCRVVRRSVTCFQFVGTSDRAHIARGWMSHVRDVF